MAPGGIHASNVDPEHFEAAIAASCLTISQRVQLHGEWRDEMPGPAPELRWCHVPVRHAVISVRCLRNPLAAVPDGSAAVLIPVAVLGMVTWDDL